MVSTIPYRTNGLSSTIYEPAHNLPIVKATIEIYDDRIDDDTYDRIQILFRELLDEIEILI